MESAYYEIINRCEGSRTEDEFNPSSCGLLLMDGPYVVFLSWPNTYS